MPLMIGIQRPTDTIQSENDVLSNFDTLFMTDDFIEHNSLDAKFGYTIFEKMDTITVKENEDDSEFMFVGSATEFIEFWDSMGEEE